MSSSRCARARRATGAGAITVIAGLLLASSRGPVSTTVTWNVAGDGNWSVATNWLPPVVPNNDATNFYDVVIDDDPGADVTVDLDVNANIDTVTIDAGDALEIQNARALSISAGQIGNAGTITWADGPTITQLSILGDTTIFGGGEVLLTRATARIASAVVGDRLTNVDNTIRGGGSIGLNVMSLTNQNLVLADSDLVPLVIDPPAAGDVTNVGNLRACNAATLQLLAGSYLNTGGRIGAECDGTAELHGGAAIAGGELLTTANGIVRMLGAPVLTDVTNNADLRLANAAGPYIVGTFDNRTSVTWDTGVTFTQLSVSGDVTLTGGGEIVLSRPTARIACPVVGDRLTNVDNTIRGGGSLGLNVMSLTNQGIVDADDAAIELILDPPGAGDATNESTMRASAAGTLRLLAGSYPNAGGTMEAIDDGLVQLETGAAVTGGTLATSGNGVVRCLGAPVLTDVASGADLRLANAAGPYLVGAFDNHGTVTWEAGPTLTQLNISGDVTLTGEGEIVLSRLTARFAGPVVGDRLTNIDNTIRGGGSIGLNVTSLTNQSLVVADDAAVPLVIDPPNAGDVTNMGNLRACDTGTLQLLAGSYLNTGGRIGAECDSVTELHTGAAITGGELLTSANGVIRMLGAPTLTGVTSNADLRLANAAGPYLVGTFDNQGTVTWEAGPTFTQLNISGDVTLSGGGEVVLSRATARIAGPVVGDRLTNFDNTIRGGGHVGINVMSLTNQGVIDADDPATVLSIDPPDAGSFINEGDLRATGDAGMTIGFGPMSTSGSVFVATNSAITRIGDFTQTSGSTIVEGELQLDAGVLDLQGGVLGGTGLVDAAVVNGAIVSPGASTGALSIEGGYTQTGAGLLDIEIGGTGAGDHDTLAIDGDAALAGTLSLSVVDGFTPVVGQTFTILSTTGTIGGTFTSAFCANVFAVTYTDQEVIVTVIGSAVTGDVNCDGVVDVDDLLEVVGRWGPCPGCPADLDGDGVVDVDDLLVVLANWTA